MNAGAIAAGNDDASAGSRIDHAGADADTDPDAAIPLAGAGPDTSRAAGGARTLLSAPLPASRFHDPLKRLKETDPGKPVRQVLRTLVVLLMFTVVWACLGKLDVIAVAQGRLVPQSLVKIVQPAEAGVLRQLLVEEGQRVLAGQVVARLDATLAGAERSSVAEDLGMQQLQLRRIEAQLDNVPMAPRPGEDPLRFAQVHSQYLAQRQAYLDSLEQESALLRKVAHEHRSALATEQKLLRALPIYQRSADAYAKLERDGFISALGAAEKQRDVQEKSNELEAQRATVAALSATMDAQRRRIAQLKSAERNALQKEVAEVRARIAQLLPSLDKSAYREALMVLRAPQDGLIKDLSTTTLGAVVQPGAVLMTLVPDGEVLFADVAVHNVDVGFVFVGQQVQLKLLAYPFQRHGMLRGTVVHIGADASEGRRDGYGGIDAGVESGSSTGLDASAGLVYKARVRLETQTLVDPSGRRLTLVPGMQVSAEINQGKRTVMAYFLSPLQKVVSEAARER